MIKRYEDLIIQTSQRAPRYRLSTNGTTNEEDRIDFPADNFPSLVTKLKSVFASKKPNVMYSVGYLDHEYHITPEQRREIRDLTNAQ